MFYLIGKNKKKYIRVLHVLIFACIFLSSFSFVFAQAAPAVTQERLNDINNASLSADSIGTPTATFNPADPTNGGQSYENRSFSQKQTKVNASDVSLANPGPGAGGIKELFLAAIRELLMALRTFLGLLLSVAATLFEFVVDPRSMSGEVGILNSPAVEEVWVMVRDFLNMFFILVLLFSAFATIFQVDKYSIKKVWLNLLINALLVNFSFPIARFIIDISNVAMYYMLNNMFTGAVSGGSGIMNGFASVSHMGSILNPGQHDGSITYLIASIVFIFIFGMTLMVLAALFLVRLVALTMLVMFSPIGFVGYIFPSTKGYADKWWDNLFKYAFFGPIMVLIMMVALKVMESVNTYNSSLMASKGQMQGTSGSEGSWIADVAFYLIPITILWMGMSYAQSSGVAMAGTVVGKVKKGGDWLRGAMWNMTGGAAWKGSGIPGAYKKAQEDFSKNGKLFGKRVPLMGSKYRDEREARMAGFATGGNKGYQNTKQNQDAAAVKDAAEKKDMGNMTELDLKNIVSGTGSIHDKAAARIELSNRNAAKVEDILDVREKFGENSKVYNQLRNKMKTYDPTAAFALSKDKNTGEITFDSERMREHLNSNQFDHKKLSVDALKNELFIKMAFDQKALDSKAVKDIADKSPDYSNELGKSISKVLSNNTYNNKDKDEDKNLQLAHLALKGTVHESLSKVDKNGNPADSKEKKEMREEIFKKLSKDNAAGLDADLIEKYAEELATHINGNKMAEILKNLKKDANTKLFMDKIRDLYAKNPTNDKYKRLEKMLRTDPYLKTIR